MIWFAVAVVLIASTEPVCGKLRSVPLRRPSSCRRMIVNRHAYASFFSSVTMTCKPCSQPYTFQRRSRDGQIQIFYSDLHLNRNLKAYTSIIVDIKYVIDTVSPTECLNSADRV